MSRKKRKNNLKNHFYKYKTFLVGIWLCVLFLEIIFLIVNINYEKSFWNETTKMMIGFIALVLFFHLIMIKLIFTKVEISKEGIMLSSFKKTTLKIEWDEIIQIRTHRGKNFLSEIIIFYGKCNQRIMLPYCKKIKILMVDNCVNESLIKGIKVNL